MKQVNTRHLFDYWDELRAGRAAPDRAAIDPTAIRDVLANTFLIKTDEDEAGFPMPVIGSRLDWLLGETPRGADFLGAWRVASRAPLRDLVEAVQDEQAPVVAGAFVAPQGLEPCLLELLLLPLRHRGKTHARVLGGLFPATFPAWYGLRRAGPMELGSWRVVDPPCEARLRERPLTPAERRKQLILIEGGRSEQSARPSG